AAAATLNGTGYVLGRQNIIPTARSGDNSFAELGGQRRGTLPSSTFAADLLAEEFAPVSAQVFSKPFTGPTNSAVGQSFDDYVAGTKLRALDESGQLLRQEK